MSIPHLRLSPRYATWLWLGAVFFALNLATRLALLLFEGDWRNAAPLLLVRILTTGLLYDAAVLSYVLLPFALLALLLPDSQRGRRWHGVLTLVLVTAGLMAMLFIGMSELVFWNEFSTRFNFIAVDYLVYTREVVGNIRESYPVTAIVGGIAALAALLTWLLHRPLWRAASAAGGRWPLRLLAFAGSLLLALASFAWVTDAPREALAGASARELAGNGYYEFCRAFRSNDLDFQTFYKTLPASLATEVLRAELRQHRKDITFIGSEHPLQRQITGHGTPQQRHVVLVSMESMGSEFIEMLGGKPGLSPNLDRLAHQGLSFTQLYATGLRTVRGLEALTLSLPPTPGQAVPMRKNNKGLQTLGGVLRQHGYQSLYIYGGYSYFDNMQDFFAGNGYTVIDRSALAPERISHETIWGVADEDLFGLTLREIDARSANGGKVFAHVMTTSNHRPFTFPGERIDLASGAGRDAAVKYSDWAIGQFMQQAATRPWFAQTLFVFVADHTSKGRGRVDLPLKNYRIPLIFYAPGLIAPQRVDTLASQIDVAPTLLALLNFSYTSTFFGHDILTEGPAHQRAFMSNYLTVGYLEGGRIAELMPKQRARVLDASSGALIPADDVQAQAMLRDTVAYFQSAAEVLRRNPVVPATTPLNRSLHHA